MTFQTPKRTRAGKTTRTQYMLYLEELKSNNAFRENKFDANQPHVIEQSWEKLVQTLNASGGPSRNVKEWKKVSTKCNIVTFHYIKQCCRFLLIGGLRQNERPGS